MMPNDFNPKTHLRGDDGKIYERRVVAATGVAVGQHGEPKTALGAAMEKAMIEAIKKAHANGKPDPADIKRQMTVARDQVEQDFYGDDGA